MKSVFVILAVLLFLAFFLAKCPRTYARSFGGTQTITLERGQKLVTSSWKGDSLWYLTRSMTEHDIAETYRYHEDAAIGFLNGTIIIVESK